MELDPRNPVMVWGGGGAVSVDCGTGVVGGPASAFLSGTDGCVDFAGDVAVGVTSPAVLAGEVAVVMVYRPLLGRRLWPMLGWRPWPMLGCRPWPMLAWRPWPMLGWHPWPMLGWPPWGGVLGRSYWQCCHWSEGLDCTGSGENRENDVLAVAGIVRFLMIWCVAIVKWIVVIVHRPTLGVGRCRRFVTILGMIRGQGERVVILTDRMLLMAGLSFPGVGQVLG